MPGASRSTASLIAWFNHLPPDAASVAGGKGASLGRMAQAGLPVPPGFVVCAAAFREFLALHGGVHQLWDGLSDSALESISEESRSFILSKPLPAAVEEAIRTAYLQLGDDVRVAVRSSAASEDGDAASFAGQQETYLNVRGAEAVTRRVQECWASFFSPRAMFYRSQKGVLTDIDMAVVVQEMVLAEKSGVMFTVDPVHRRRDHLMIEAVVGLGEALVSGMITPDHYVIDRNNGSLVREFIAVQGGARVLSDNELKDLREMGLRLEAFFEKPQDIEWCIRGTELLLLQSRPITTL